MITRKIWDSFPIKHPVTKILYTIVVDTRLHPIIRATATEVVTGNSEEAMGFVEYSGREMKRTTIVFINFGFEIHVRAK